MIVDYLILDWNPDEFYYTCLNRSMGLVYRSTLGLVRTENGSEMYLAGEYPTEGENIDAMKPMIEAGFPAASPGDFDAVKAIAGKV